MKTAYLLPLLGLLFIPLLAFGDEGINRNNLLGFSPQALKNGGTLLIGGGGPMPDAVFKEFIRLAGGNSARIVLIPSGYPYNTPMQMRRCFGNWLTYKLDSFQFLDVKSSSEADSPQSVAVIDNATGLWIAGGYQSRLMHLLGGTKAEAAMHRLLDRGGVIGATSAGASALSEMMIYRGSMTEADVGKGLGFINNAVVDQHFEQRGREARLEDILEDHPGINGLGIDEQTALIVRGNHLRVVGANRATILLWTGLDRSMLLYRLQPGEEANLDLNLTTSYSTDLILHRIHPVVHHTGARPSRPQ
jgi:cyanophycinase